MLDGFRCVAWRELLTASRLRRMFLVRALSGAFLGSALFLGVAFVVVQRVPVAQTWGADWWAAEVAPDVVRDGAQAGFAAMLAVAAGLGLGLLSREVAGTFAGEREKRTLDSLLTTRLRVFEIVAGKLSAGLILYLSAAAVALPLVILAGLFGGTDLGLALMGAAGVGATAFALGALNLAVSVFEPTRRKAQNQSTLLAVAWLDLPFLVVLLGPLFFPRLYAYVEPVARLGVASSPVTFIAGFVGLTPGWTLESGLARMVGLELLTGLALLALACFRLRPASRRLSGLAEKSGGAGRKARRPTGKRTPCGDDPMEWKERHAARVGTPSKVLGVVAFGTMFVLLGAVSLRLGWTAWMEVVLKGYGSAAVGDERWAFNQGFVRAITAVVVFIQLLVIAGTTAESLDLERKRGTWLVLLSTPLSGREILGAKRRASLRRTRPFTTAVVGVWVMSAVMGAVHPLGLVLATCSLVATHRFASSLGAYSAVRAAGLKPGTNLALYVLLACALLTPGWVLLTGRVESVVALSVSPPLVSTLSLLSWDEVNSARGAGEFGGLLMLLVPAGPSGGGWLLSTAVLGTAGLAAAAFWLDREVDRTWDASAGRPARERLGVLSRLNAPS